jgi:hypothetical protein
MATPRNTDDQGRPKEPSEIVRYWVNEITQARKREKDWRKDGQDILDIYSAKHETPFNILFSNTETLLPALYSAVPRPVVTRRFKDVDPLGKAAAEAAQRILSFLLDTNNEGYETFDEAMRMATLDALLPGRGVTVVKYDAEIQDALLEREVDEQETPAEQAAEDERDEQLPYTSGELVCLDTRAWDRVYFGYAKKWSKVPWMAYEEYLDKEEATKLFGEKIVDELTFSAGDVPEDNDYQRSAKDEQNKGERKTACFYQIWDKDGGKKVRYISPNYKEGYLRVDDDPLGLTGFFNCPRPLQFIEKSNDLRPTPMYALYKNQARELNRLTQRIHNITEAIKARGVYSSDMGETLGNILKGDDNTLVPAENSSTLAFEKGIGNAIWMWPVETLVQVLIQLYQAREACKVVIYEITGIADIMRGTSAASETLGAQQIKQSWGTLRLKRLQREIQRYSRDLLRLMLEIAATKFSEDTWAKMTGLPYTTTMVAQQLAQIAFAAQQSGQPLDAQTQAAMRQPRWADVLEMLRDDTQRAYRVDIETNSTIAPEASEDQQHITEMMTAMGQFLNGVAPLVAKGVMPFQIAQSMLLAISRRFQFGTEVEGFIQQMAEPPKDDSAKNAEAMKQQAEMQLEQARLQFETQKFQAEFQQTTQIELGKHQREVDAGKQAQMLAMETLRLQHEHEMHKLEAERRLKLSELQSDKMIEEMKARMQQETELQKASMQMQTQLEVARIAACAAAMPPDAPKEELVIGVMS